MFLNLKKLQERAKSTMSALEAIAPKLEEAEAKNDAEAIKNLTAEYKAKSAEFDAVEGQIKEAEAHAKRQDRLSALDKLAEIDGAKSIAGAAEPADHAKAEAELDNKFVDWMCGKTLSDSARDALAPQSKWSKAASENAVVLPRRFANAILPERELAGPTRAKALPTVSTGAPGNQLFYPEFKPQVLMYQALASFLFPLVNRVPTRAGTVIFPKLVQAAPGAEGGADEFAEVGGVSCAWTAEGAEKPDSEAEITQQQFKTYEVSAYTELSHTLINRSAVDVEQLLTQLFRTAILMKIDRAILNGDGNGKPTGILQTAGIGSVPRADVGLVGYNDLVDLESSIAPEFRENAVFVMADGAAQYLKKIKDKNDRPLFSVDPSFGAAVRTLMGYNYFRSRRMSALGVAGDVVFCDPSQYVCPVEQEVVISSSDHYKFRQGVRAFVVFAQVGGGVAQTQAFTRLTDHV